MRWELIILDGSDKRFPLPPAGEVLVGSAAECAIRLAVADVSRRHALLTVRRGKISVLDLGSKNGTFVAGQRVKEATLAAGDLVRFSSVLAQLMPVGSSWDEGEGQARASGVGSHRQLSPTDEMPAGEDTLGIGWLLARWGREGGSAMAVTLEWIVRTAGARGAAVLLLEGADRVVEAASGEIEGVLASGTLVSTLSRASQRARALETIALEDEAGEVLALKCIETCWLLLALKDVRPTAGQMELYARAVTVAHRLDH